MLLFLSKGFSPFSASLPAAQTQWKRYERKDAGVTPGFSQGPESCWSQVEVGCAHTPTDDIYEQVWGGGKASFFNSPKTSPHVIHRPTFCSNFRELAQARGCPELCVSRDGPPNGATPLGR